MSGHSHFNNIKHKKDKNSKIKSKSFLKIREKIKLIIKNGDENDNKKAFALARENNFPKEKVELMINEVLKTRKNNNYSTKIFDLNIFKCKFNIFMLIFNHEGFLNDDRIKEIFENYSVFKLEDNKIFDIFKRVYFLKVRVRNENFEEFLIKSLKDDVLNNVEKVLKIYNSKFDFEVIVYDKKNIDKILNISKDEIKDSEFGDKFLPLNSLNLDSDVSSSYFFSLKKEIFQYIPDSQIFFNTGP